MGIVLVGRWQPGNTSAWIAHDHAAVRCPVSPTALDAAFTRPSSQLFTDLSKAHTTWLFSNMFQHSSLIRLSHYHSIFFFSRSFLSHCVWHVIGNDDDDDSFIDYQLQSGNVDKSETIVQDNLTKQIDLVFILQIRGMDSCLWIVTRFMVSSYRINLMAHIFLLRLFTGRELPIKNTMTQTVPVFISFFSFWYRTYIFHPIIR